MRDRIGPLFLAGVVIGAVLVFAIKANAHHADVSASSTCVNGAPAAIVTATAWQSDQGDDHRINSDIRITVDGIEVANGAFAAPSYSFTISTPATPGTHTVSAIAVAGWGAQGQYPTIGDPPTAQVVVIDACRPPTTTKVVAPPGATTTSTTLLQLPPATPVINTPKFTG